MILTLPFAHLNLRWNPFGEPSLEERASLAVVDLPELRPGDPVQFLGEAGRGKTTHLLGLKARRPQAIYEYVPEGADRFRSQLPEGATFLLDEAQRVRPPLLAALFRRSLTLALGTHEDLSPIAGRAIRTVPIRGLVAPRLLEILVRRIEWARRGPGPVPAVSLRGAERLIERYGDDLRAMEGQLYEAVQAMKEPGDVVV